MHFQPTTLLAPLLLLPALASASSIPSYSGLTALWQDNFWGNAGASPDTSKWNVLNENLGVNDEEETYSNSNRNVQISGGGTLQLVPWRDSSVAGGWTSARLESTGSVTPAAGKKTRVEASIRMGGNAAANKQGIWPAFWMLGESMREGTSWPLCGELDILEQVNGQLTGYGTAHCDTAVGGLCDQPTGLQGATSMPSDGDNSFHVWALEWDRTSGNWQTETITWLLDGQTFSTLTGSQIGDQATWSVLAHSPYYLILNVAVGGSWPGSANSETLEGYGSMMEVQYVAAYAS